MPFPRVLVLGAAGRIGALLRACWPEGQGLWQARRAQAGPGWMIADPLADPAALARAAAGCDAVLCLAGVTPAAAARGAEYHLNTALALAAVRAGAEAGARVLLASSAAVYGRAAGPLREEDALAPVSEYGRAKAAMEEAALTLGAELGIRVCALRIGNIAGLDAALGGWRPGFVLDRFADGRTPVRSYIGPVTLARLLGELAGAELPEILPEFLNVAAPGAVEMGALLEAAGLDWTPRAAGPGAIPEVVFDLARLARAVPLDAATPESLVAEWRKVPDQIRDDRGVCR